MAWFGQQRQKGISHREWLEQEEHTRENYEIVDMASTLNAIYVAVRNKKKGYVFAEILLIKWRNNEVCNFLYKPMDEFQEPFESKCPQRILDQLTPLDEIEGVNSVSMGWARKWRHRCREYHESKVKIRKDSLIRTPEPIRFSNGATYDTFIITDGRRLHARAVNNFGACYTNVKLSRRCVRGAEVVGCQWPRE